VAKVPDKDRGKSRHHNYRESDFDPEKEGRKSAATSIEAFKKALENQAAKNIKSTHSA
jgi:hypothetical protein